MSTLHSTLPSLSAWASLRGRRPSLAPSFASIAVRHGFSTTAVGLVVEKRASAASSAAKIALEKADSLRTKAGPIEGTPPRKEPVPPHKAALTSYRHLFQTRDRWLAHQLAAGVYVPPRILSRILSDRKILAADMAIYVDVLARRDVYYAMERLGLLESAGPNRPQVHSPDWLILAIPGMLKTIQDVPYLASMLVRSRRFAQLNRENRALFIARCLQSFLRIRHLVAVRETIDWVCSSRNQLGSATAFARVLTVLAVGGNDTNKSDARLTVAPKELLHRARDRLLEVMKAKGIEPTLDTTLPLLEPGLIPHDVHETAKLIVQINRMGRKLKRGVLRRAMLSLIAAGNKEGAKVFAQSIQGLSGEDDAEASVEETETIFDSTSTAFLRLEEGIDCDGIVLPSNADAGEAILLFQRLLDRLRSPSTPDAPPKPALAEPIWARLFNLFSRSSQVHAYELQSLLRQLESSPVRMHDHTWRRVYHGVMLGLVSRHEPARVVRLWDRVTRDRPIPLGPDSHMLDVIMRAYCALGQPERARGICEAWTIDMTSEHIAHPKEDETTPASDSPPRSKRIKLDVLPLNNLMLYYFRTAAYGEIYALFKAMPSTYGVVPNSATLTILIDSARYASFQDESGGEGSRTCSTSGVLWDNREPALLVEDLFWSVLEQNWPELAKSEVVDPFRSKPSLVMDWIFARSSSSGAKSITGADGEEGASVRVFDATLSIVDPPRYPYLYPSARTFRSFILLLGSTRRYEKIPLVLAWMKALNVRPSRHTLGLAMMYVAEMAYVDEKMVKWRTWVSDWAGEDEVPREEEIAWLRRGGRGMRGRKEKG